MPRFGYKHSEETKRKMSKAKLGKKFPKLSMVLKGRIAWNKDKRTGLVPKSAFKEGHASWLKGKHIQTNSGRTHFRKGQTSGENNNHWKGGITPINKKLRQSFDYEEWRKKVFERDLYTCQKCGEVGGRLNADHIKSWSLYPELRFDVNNGQTLCENCHFIKTSEDIKIIRKGGGSYA